MKAQLTFESLLMLAIGISMLLISVVAVNQLQFAQQNMYSYSLLKNKAWEIANVADEICALGAGNSRTIYLPHDGFDFYVDSDPHAFFATYDKLNFGANTLCNLRVEKKQEFGNVVFLWYDDKEVVISSTSHNP